mgnify:CR=1 FL=1
MSGDRRIIEFSKEYLLIFVSVYCVSSSCSMDILLCSAAVFSTLEILHLESKVKVRVALTNRKNYGMVEEMLKEVIPANIWIDLSLLYNQHKTLGKFTHRQLAAYTQKEVRNEVLNHGN